MAKFFSRSDLPLEKPFTPTGNGTTPVFEERTLDNGTVGLVCIGFDNMDDFIQQGRSETDIYALIDRYNHGETDLINRVQGQYLDVVGMPKTLAEAQQRLLSVRSAFDQLPDEVKKKVGGSVDEFVQQVATGSVDSVKNLLFGHLPSDQKNAVSSGEEVEKGSVSE